MPRSETIRYAVRVPQITVYFWIVKILTTGAGESASDYLAHAINPIFAASGAFAALVIALAIQFRVRCYFAWSYWFAVVMVAIFGTMAADVLHDGLHIPYLTSTIALAIVLVIVFAAWYRSQKTLSIHSITTAKSEAFYWATVIATFALGTAVGDLTATVFDWGYLDSGIVFAIAFAVIGIAQLIGARAQSAANRKATTTVVTFWAAYILTRPLGASFADWGGKAPEKGGLGYGDGTVAVVLFVVIVLFVGYLAVTRKDVDANGAAVR